MKPFHAVVVVVFGLFVACSQSTDGSAGSGGASGSGGGAGSGAAGTGGDVASGGQGGSGGEGGSGGAFCGDGHIDGGEQCDDGNRNDDDDCTNDCTVARCGDGVVATYTTLAYSSLVLTTPRLKNPFGVGPAYVASTGSGCIMDGDCDPSAQPTAPEHGICKALGFGLAYSVNWNSTVGSGEAIQLHANNWKCDSVRSCGPGTADTNQVCFPNTACMLKTIDCRGEQCDDGPNNSDDKPDACRTNCRKPFCGDGVVDSGEACDDGGIQCLPDCSGLK